MQPLVANPKHRRVAGLCWGFLTLIRTISLLTSHLQLRGTDVNIREPRVDKSVHDAVSLVIYCLRNSEWRAGTSAGERIRNKRRNCVFDPKSRLPQTSSVINRTSDLPSSEWKSVVKLVMMGTTCENDCWRQWKPNFISGLLQAPGAKYSYSVKLRGSCSSGVVTIYAMAAILPERRL